MFEGVDGYVVPQARCFFGKLVPFSADAGERVCWEFFQSIFVGFRKQDIAMENVQEDLVWEGAHGVDDGT